MNIFNDLRFGLRQLLARPGFTLAAVLSLAIGIGATAALFAVVNTLLLSPVAGIGAPQNVVEVGRTTGHGFDTLSYPDFRDYAANAKSFDGMFAYSLQALNVSRGDEPQRALAFLVSGEYFPVLQARALRGRLLGAADDDESNPQPVAVASFAAWQKYFGGDESAIGKDVSVNGRHFTLIGVAQPEFRGHVAVLSPDFYLPLHQRRALRDDGQDLFSSRRSLWLLAGGRLKQGVSIDAAQAELSTIARQLAASYPDLKQDGTPREAGIGVVSLRGVPESVRGPLGAFSALLFVLIGAILLVACVNVAGMLIARGESRRHEIAMRFVLGASRGRVIKQLLAESFLLALAAGAIGILLARWGSALIVLIDPPAPFPIKLDVALGTPVIVFALVLTLLTTLLFGLMPALRVSNRTPRQSGAMSSSQIAGRGSRLRESLVVAQIALTLVLLVSAGLFLRALQRASSINVGFDVQHVYVADFDLNPSGYAEDKRIKLQQRLLDGMAALGGVQSASLAAVVPLNFSNMSYGCVQGSGLQENELCPNTNLVAGDFFATLGMHVRGRGIDATDVHGGRDVVVINQTMAQRLAADGDALGRSFAYGEGKELRTLTVVGIVPDGKYASLSDEVQPFMFMPLAQWPNASTTLFVRSGLGVEEFAVQLRTQLRGLDGSLPMPQVHPLQDMLALSLLPQRIAGMIAGVLGAVGLLLAALGLYGLIAYHVASRTREFGVKLAIGATPARLLGEVLSRGAWLCGIGLVVGGAVACGLAMLMSSLLFGVRPGDVLAFAGAGVVLGAVALFACYLPARRVAKLQPTVALRYE